MQQPIASSLIFFSAKRSGVTSIKNWVPPVSFLLMSHWFPVPDCCFAVVGISVFGRSHAASVGDLVHVIEELSSQKKKTLTRALSVLSPGGGKHIFFVVCLCFSEERRMPCHALSQEKESTSSPQIFHCTFVEKSHFLHFWRG